MSVEPLRPEPAVVTINAAPGCVNFISELLDNTDLFSHRIPVRPTKPRVLAFTPEEHNLKYVAIALIRLTALISLNIGFQA